MLAAAKGTKGLYYSFRGKEMRCGWSGVQFRRWATEHLSEYLVKGFTMDDEPLSTTFLTASPNPPRKTPSRKLRRLSRRNSQDFC